MTVDEQSSLEALAAQVHQTAAEHGWWETDGNVGEKCMLMVTELAEAFEHYRDGRAVTEIFYHADGKPDGVAVELADTVIRILDFCYHHNIPLSKAMLEKMRYNATRSYKHGGKVC